MTTITRRGITVTETDALRLAELTGSEFVALSGRVWAQAKTRGETAQVTRTRISVYAELRRELNGLTGRGNVDRMRAKAASPVATDFTLSPAQLEPGLVAKGYEAPKGTVGDRIHARHVAKGLPASVGTKRDGTPKAHCFGCFLNLRAAK